MDNDVRIEDRTVSRRHLKIVRRAQQYFITDLESRNGTFYKGNYLAPGVELEVKEGEPIAVGMTLIGIGKGCLEQMMPILDSMILAPEAANESSFFEIHGDRTNQKRLELLYGVSDILFTNTPLHERLEKILDFVLKILGRIDRGSFILVDPETEKITSVVSISQKEGNKTASVYCTDVVRRVIEEKKPVVISNAETEEGTDDILGTLKILKINSVLCVPLFSDSGIMGTLYLDSVGRPYGFGQEDVSLFMDFGQRIGMAIEGDRVAFDLTTVVGGRQVDSQEPSVP